VEIPDGAHPIGIGAGDGGPSSAATLGGSTRLTPKTMTSSGRSPARETIDLAICATPQRTDAAASAAL
jgi:hypothetical protein